MQVINLKELTEAVDELIEDESIDLEKRNKLLKAINYQWKGDYCPKCGWTLHSSLNNYIHCDHCNSNWFIKE